MLAYDFGKSCFKNQGQYFQPRLLQFCNVHVIGCVLQRFNFISSICICTLIIATYFLL